MKTKLLFLGALIIAVCGGCNGGYYSPASPDFYPSDRPPFTNSASLTPSPHKAVVANLAPAASLADLARR